MMRHRWQVLLVLVLSLTVPRIANAQCEEDGVSALADARSARGVVSDLALMRAWNRQVARDMQPRSEEDDDGEEVEVRSAASWLRWTDSFSGFRLCQSDTPVDLDREWWGAHAEFDDLKTGVGYELFYLAATDELVFPDELGDVEYGWRHRIAGAELRFRDWVAIRGGTIDIKRPTRTGAAEHEGSAYLSLSVPRFGIGADLLLYPGTRKLDMLMLAVRRAPLPIAGLSVSAHGGWLENEQKGLAGLGLSALGDAVQLNVVVEGAPVRLRSVAVRIEALYRAAIDEGIWLDSGIAPFVEVSAFNGGVFHASTGRSFVPGATTGLRSYVTFGVLSAGLEGFVGVNDPGQLGQLTRAVDRTHWGGRAYLRIAR